MDRATSRAAPAVVEGKVRTSRGAASTRTIRPPRRRGLWEQHLKVVLRSVGGEEIQDYPGNFWVSFPAPAVVYVVDDLTLSGPQEEHQAFVRSLHPWSTLSHPSPSVGFR